MQENKEDLFKIKKNADSLNIYMKYHWCMFSQIY